MRAKNKIENKMEMKTMSKKNVKTDVDAFLSELE